MNGQKCIFSGPFDPASFKGRSLGQILQNTLQSKDKSSVALVDVAENQNITYGDLLEYAYKLAQELKDGFNIQKDDVVAIVSTNSWKSIVVIMSTFFCGGTVCSVNPNYSKLELLHAFKISKPKIVFALDSVLERINSIESLSLLHFEKVLLDANTDKTYNTFNELLNTIKVVDYEIQEYDPKEKICFILNSSGTTGFPKGVMLTEEGVIQSFMYLKYPHQGCITQNTITLALLPLFHIFGILTTFASLVTGQEVIVMNKFNPGFFLKCIEDYHINTLFVVPQILSFMSSTQLLDNYNISSLKTIVVGAAPLLLPLENKITKRLPNVRIQQIYGATEICGATTLMPQDHIKAGSVGKLVPNMLAKIIDIKSGKMLSYNEVGEICVKSPGLMKGYKDNEEETTSSIKDGWWHTGDVGYFDEDEYLFLVGRIKELIKYKGFQVAPVQLEDVISSHFAVKDVGVVGKPDDRAGELPTALVVKNDNVEISENDIIQFVKEKLSPESQLHGGVIFVKDIPRNPSGKILRQKLKEMLNN